MAKLTSFVLVFFLFSSNIMARKIEWTPAGPEGGFLLCLAVSSENPDILYAGCDIYGGIYKSTNAGESWTFLGMVSELGNIIDIKIHPTSDEIVYAACDHDGIYKTENGGKDWDLIFHNDDAAYCIGIDPKLPDVIYTGLLIDEASDYALYRSFDGGLTWSDSSFQGISVLEILFDPDSINTLYAGTSYGVHQSIDNGKTWRFRGPPGASASILSLVIANDSTWYAGSQSDSRDSGTVYKTENCGET